MGAFSEQLTTARKAAHLTQEQLAEKVHVTRAAVSHWENGRYLPDFDMIRELSRALDYRFDINGVAGELAGGDAAEAAAVPAETTAVPAETSAPPTETGPDPEPTAADGPRGHAGYRRLAAWICAAALVITAVLFLTGGLPGGKDPAQQEFTAENEPGVRYRISDYQAVTPREDGKAYLVINTESRVEHGENKDFWMYSFVMHEDQEPAFRLTETELVYFFTDHVHPTHYLEKDLAAAQIGPELPYGHTVSFDGGCPMDQKNMTGVGFKAIGRDENGAELSFTAYIPFPAP